MLCATIALLVPFETLFQTGRLANLPLSMPHANALQLCTSSEATVGTAATRRELLQYLQVVPDCQSRSALGETCDGGLVDIFARDFGPPGCQGFETARNNFLRSEAGCAGWFLWRQYTAASPWLGLAEDGPLCAEPGPASSVTAMAAMPPAEPGCTPHYLKH